jgi:ribosomal protein S13
MEQSTTNKLALENYTNKFQLYLGENFTKFEAEARLSETPVKTFDDNVNSFLKGVQQVTPFDINTQNSVDKILSGYKKSLINLQTTNQIKATQKSAQKLIEDGQNLMRGFVKEGDIEAGQTAQNQLVLDIDASNVLSSTEKELAKKNTKLLFDEEQILFLVGQKYEESPIDALDFIDSLDDSTPTDTISLKGYTPEEQRTFVKLATDEYERIDAQSNRRETEIKETKTKLQDFTSDLYFKRITFADQLAEKDRPDQTELDNDLKLGNLDQTRYKSLTAYLKQETALEDDLLTLQEINSIIAQNPIEAMRLTNQLYVTGGLKRETFKQTYEKIQGVIDNNFSTQKSSEIKRAANYIEKSITKTIDTFGIGIITDESIVQKTIDANVVFYSRVNEGEDPWEVSREILISNNLFDLDKPKLPNGQNYEDYKTALEIITDIAFEDNRRELTEDENNLLTNIKNYIQNRKIINEEYKKDLSAVLLQKTENK